MAVYVVNAMMMMYWVVFHCFYYSVFHTRSFLITHKVCAGHCSVQNWYTSRSRHQRCKEWEMGFGCSNPWLTLGFREHLSAGLAPSYIRFGAFLTLTSGYWWEHFYELPQIGPENWYGILC